MKSSKQNRLIWLAVCAVYLLFIYVFSYIYPHGLDEYPLLNLNLHDILARTVNNFLYQNSRICVFVGTVVFYIGKWFFLLINTFVPLAIVFGMFYMINGRKPDFETLKDIAMFVLLMILSVFAAPAPDNTIFWMAGAINYTWTFLLIIFYLCALRALLEGKTLFKDSLLSCILSVLWGVSCGMSNENSGPMVLLIAFFFFIYVRLLKQEKLPKWFYFFFAACTIGVGVLLLGPGLRARMQYDILGFSAVALKDKLFFHINHIDNFIKSNFLLPAVNFFVLLLLGIDWDKKAFKNTDYISALLSFVICGILAFVLFPAPDVGLRPFYSAAMFSILTFVFLLKYLLEEYKLNFLKYISMASIIFAVVILPLFAAPYISLYQQNQQREAMVKQAIARGDKVVYLPYFLVERNLARPNYTIMFYDSLYATPQERLQFYKIPVIPVKTLPQFQQDGVQFTIVY